MWNKLSETDKEN